MLDDTTPPDEPTSEQPVEALPAAPKPLIAYQAHAFSSFTQVTERPEGQTVADMVASLGFPADYEGYVHVWINDLPLDREEWEHVIPSDGQMVYVRVIPQGGGGGKDVLRVVAAIAIVVVAVATGQVYGAQFAAFLTEATGFAISSAAATAAITAGVTIVGNLALNALIPPPKLELDFGGGLGAQKNQLTGSSNRYAPYAPIPRVFGKRRLYPLLAGRPYSETQGDNEYLRMALLVGWGPLRITDIRIGDTPITSFANVEYEVREGWANDSALTLYTNTITEASYSILLEPSTANTRTTETGVTEISVDVTAPAGLAKFENDGKRSSIDVDVTVEYRAVGGSTWLTPTWTNSSDPGLDVNGRIRMSGADTSAIRRTGRFSVTTGQYEVRLTRTTSQYDTTKHVQEVRWTVMRSVKPSYPVQQTGLALIAFRMKATGQLNGIPQQISCLAESYLPVYNGSTWSFQISRNPAWAFADVLRRRGGQTYLADDRIDLTSIQAWATACDATAPNASEARWTFDGVVEGGSVFQVLRQIAASARANYTVRDGKHSVVRDIQQTVPIQHITPRNSFGYSGSKVFLDYPHALRVVFVNADKNYEEDERIVYDDGYNAGNATKFETLELFGCTSASQAYREARYFIAAARLRPETHVVTMDIENLACTIGDLVQFQHDVVSIGIASARIVSVVGPVITLDQQIDCTVGTSYAMRVRQSNGNTTVVSLQNPGTITTAAFTATTSTVGLTPGDLVMFGVSTSVSAPMIVKRIEPGPDLTAKLTLVDAQSGVYTADTGSIPAFNSNITNTTPPEERRPDAPTSISMRSDDAAALLMADGTVQVRIAVTPTTPVSSVVPVGFYDVQWRAVGGVNWIEQRFPRGTPIFLSPVQEGVTHEVRVRSVSIYSVVGDWSATFTHTVSGKNLPPANVTGFTAGLKVGQVVFSWNAAVDLDYSFTELRYGATWAAGTFLWKGSTTSYAWPRPTNGTYKVWAAHVDTSGNYSATPVSVDVTVSNAIDPERTILLTIYRRSTTTPALPSANATYDFSTNTLSGLNNGWTLTAPSGDDPLWVATATTTGNVTDTIAPAEWSAAQQLLTSGLTTAVVELFQRTATNTAPTVNTAGSTTYTFATGAVSGQPSGWSGTVPSSGGGYLWVIRATAAASGATDTIANTEWTSPALLAQDGAQGATGATGPQGPAGVANALIYIYQRSASSPTLPSATVTYTFSTGALTGLNNGWSQTIPAGTDPLWAAVATASSSSGSDTIASNEWSTPVVLVQNGANGTNGVNGADGLNAATIYLFQRTSGSTPSLPSANVTYTFATGVASGVNNGWSQTMPTSGGSFRWVTTATAASTSSTDVIAPSEWAAVALLAQDGSQGPQGPQGTAGANGSQSAVVYLYQWASVQPANPNGSSTYTWASGTHSSYTGGNFWSTSVPANPGTPGLLLWIAQKSVTGTAGDTTATVSWASGFTVAALSTNGLNGANGANGSNGANGVQTARPTIYQWASTIPAGPSGTSTYTWSTGSFTAVPFGWSANPSTSPSPGFTLWAASVTLTESATVSSSTIFWTGATISAVGYAGTQGPQGPQGATGATGATGASGQQGASARMAYARIPNNPAPVSGIIPVSGDNRPTATDSANYWGIFVSWSASDPNPSSTDTLYQTDGIYNPATNTTSWSTPYISSLKVGSLSAITVNTGSLSVNGTLTVGAGGDVRSSNFSAGTSGWFIGPTLAEFNNITARGNIEASSLKVNTAMVQTLNINGSAVTVPVYGSSFFDTYTFGTGWTTVQTMTVPVTGLQTGEYIGLIINSVSSIYPADNVVTDVILGIFINGVLVSELAASIDFYGFSHAGAGYALVTNGSNTVEFKYRVGATKTMTILTYATALAGKR